MSENQNLLQSGDNAHSGSANVSMSSNIDQFAGNINRSTVLHHHHQQRGSNDDDDGNGYGTSPPVRDSNTNPHQHPGGGGGGSGHDDAVMNRLESTPQKNSKKRLTCENVVLALCILFILGGAIGLGVIDLIIKAYVKKMVRIEDPSSPIFEAWLDPSAHGVKTYRKFYMYNITNPFEITLHGEKPNIVVVGPFVYSEVWKKDRNSVGWYINGTLRYRYNYTMHFDPDHSIDEVTKRKLSEGEMITTINGPLRGTLFRVGRLPEIVVEDPVLNITRQIVCDLLDFLVNDTILGPKGAFIRRPLKEIVWGYVDPIWDELHVPLSLFNYTASTFFQAQWNGSAVAPSPYTYRSGQMCPLWQSPGHCNNTASDVTLQVSGRTNVEFYEADRRKIEQERQWDSDARIPSWMKREYSLLSSDALGDIVQYAGQHDGQWWWGPMQPGLTGGDAPFPDSAAFRPQKKMNLQQKQGSSSSSLAGDDHDDGDHHDVIPPNACRRQYGSDGTRFALPVDKSKFLHIFNDMMGRTFPFAFAHDSTVDSFDTWRFSMSHVGLSNSSVNRFCYQQRFDGFINVSQFVFGPGLVSKAMYLDTCVAKQLVSSSDGGGGGVVKKKENENEVVCIDPEIFHPSDLHDRAAGDNDDGFTGSYLPFNITFSKHYGGERYSLDAYLNETIGGDSKSEQFRNQMDTFVDVFPLTGNTMSAHARGMISLALGPMFARGCAGNISNFTRNMPRTIVPYLRLDRTGEISGALLQKLKDAMVLITAAHVILGVFLGLGVVGAIVIVIKKKFCSRDGGENSAVAFGATSFLDRPNKEVQQAIPDGDAGHLS